MDTVAKAIDKASLELDGYTRQWQNRQISNVSFNSFSNLPYPARDSNEQRCITVRIPSNPQPIRQSYTQWYAFTSVISLSKHC